MKTVSDLSRLRRALGRGVCIKSSVIAADDLDFRMLLETVSRGPGSAIRQQFHHLAMLQVDDDRPESHTFPPSPFIDAGDTDNGTDGRRSARSFTLRRIVVLLIGTPSLAINRSEDRPPTLWPNSLTIPASRVVRRANGIASVEKPLGENPALAVTLRHRQRVSRAWMFTGLP